jgi:hypothetical protein
LRGAQRRSNLAPAVLDWIEIASPPLAMTSP